jgi:hypothetical protein
VHVVHNHGVICDDAVFAPAVTRIANVARPVLSIVIAGRARIRWRGLERWLEAGDI